MRILRGPFLAVLALAASHLAAATFGTVVTIGGHASDLALDTRRGQLYVSNFAGKRIDVISTADNQLRNPIRVDAEPESIALSPDARYLLVGQYGLGGGSSPAVTILDLDADTRSVVPIPQPPPSSATAQPANERRVPLSIAFGNGSKALLVTNLGIYLVDPPAGTFEKIIEPPLQCGKVPTQFATFPPQITRASSTLSGNGEVVLVSAEYQSSAAGSGGSGTPTTATCSVSGATGGPDTMLIRFDTATGSLTASGTTSAPPDGPRVVSTDLVGSNVLVGWGLVNAQNVLLAQFPYPTGAFNIGSHAYDYSRNLIYAQVPSSVAGASADPVLHVLDTDNLTVRERLRLAENLAGRSVFSPDMNTLYAISDSGVTVLPIGSLNTARRVAARQEQLLFPANNCDNRVITAVLNIDDLGGGRTDFTLSVPSSAKGVRFSQTSGTTPASITVQVDPSAFRSDTGTTAVPVTITSGGAVNIPDSVRLLINTKEPDQRGVVASLPGTIVDVLADPVRNRVYALRQDRNQVLVLDPVSLQQIAVLRTGNTPTQMALTRDNRYMIVGNDNSQIASVLDLETLQSSDPIVFPGGQYPRSISVSNSAMFGLARNVSKTTCDNNSNPAATIDRIDFPNRIARLNCDELGVYVNNVPADSVMIASPSGGSIFTAMADGTVLLYNDGYDAFQASRKDSTSLAGVYSAVSDGMFIAGTNLYNSSLVTTGTIGGSSIAGVLPFGDTVLTVGSATAAGAGVVQRVLLQTGQIVRPIRTIEAPVTAAMLKTPAVGQIGQSILPFLRTMAQTSDGTMVYLSVSGLATLPPNFDAPSQMPKISSVVNIADGGAVASGSLIRITGSGLSASTASAGSLPLPTTLGEMCATVNSVPVPLIRVSSAQVNAQMPFEVAGTGTLVITAPGGKSTPFSVNVAATAPAVFRAGEAGGETGLPLIYRAQNADLVSFSNPVHPNDVVVVYATGLGRTAPDVASGAAAPEDPLAAAVAAVTANIGNTPLYVAFAGLVPGQVGVYQINLLVPSNIPAAREAALSITQGSTVTTFPVRVVNP
jgi:uncharacterized protein (TIGR03437 family)